MKIIQTYCKEKFFISTILRPSSCIESPSDYYETLVFKWDKTTKKPLEMIEQHEDSTESQAIETQYSIIRRLSVDLTNMHEGEEKQ